MLRLESIELDLFVEVVQLLANLSICKICLRILLPLELAVGVTAEAKDVVEVLLGAPVGDTCAGVVHVRQVFPTVLLVDGLLQSFDLLTQDDAALGSCARDYVVTLLLDAQ
jgi:hypothetical protein